MKRGRCTDTEGNTFLERVAIIRLDGNVKVKKYQSERVQKV